MLNRIDVIGRLAKPIELKRTNSDTTVCSFELACDRDFKTQSGEKVTDWITCVAWRQNAEYLSRYAGKGDMVSVSGSLQSRKWKDREGNTRTAWEVQADKCYILSSKQRQDTKQDELESDSGNQWQDIEDDGDLPF